MFDYLSFIEEQVALWPMAAENYRRLGLTERRSLSLGDLTVGIQLNPARIVSTGAKIDASGNVGTRPCFLCADNRPPEQIPYPLMTGWQLLLNPFPVFPVHFTIVNTKHTPQTRMPLEMASMAESLPGLTVFFNGARSGASAPDHLHCQAVLTEELPLMQLCMKYHPLSRPGIEIASSWGLDLPFDFWSAVITPDTDGMRTLQAITHACGIDPDTGQPDSGRVNSYFWRDSSGLLRAVAVPRSGHRPACYYAEDDSKRLISPGAVEMAGVVITPRADDYRRLSAEELRRIYAETGIASLI
ncbi:MAG: DUF4922 domain-containing protein [Muribaculaceae bacterium]|nr:DUF4922 domain-containing protein [Muribaculaceae bacterium]